MPSAQTSSNITRPDQLRAVDLIAMLLPGMLERRTGTLLYVTGLGAVVPLPGWAPSPSHRRRCAPTP